MPSIITVTPTDSFSCAFSIDGASAAVIVDLHQWATLADLTAALGALAERSNTTVRQHRTFGVPKGLRGQTDPGAPGARVFGPYGAHCYALGGENMRMFAGRPGWTAIAAAQSEKQGPGIGPVGAAIVADADDPGYATATSVAVAGALQALVGRLP